MRARQRRPTAGATQRCFTLDSARELGIRDGQETHAMHSRLASIPLAGCSISLITDGASRFQNWTTVAPARIRDAIDSVRCGAIWRAQAVYASPGRRNSA